MPTPETIPADHTLTLAEALGIAAFSAPTGGDTDGTGTCEVVAFTGSGGKTTAMFRLAAELVARGGRVLITTTTHIYSPEPQGFSETVIEDSLEALVRSVRSALTRHPVVVLARGLKADQPQPKQTQRLPETTPKLVGIDPAWIEQLRKQLQVTHLLVEADGSRGRPFKAPAAHEPVIPPSADLVVPVVGLSVIGQALSKEFVHRPERVAELTGCCLGDTITPSLVASVLLHPQGSARGTPAHARVVILLNQADDEGSLQAGCEVARELIERGVPSEPVFGSVGCQRGAERVVIAALRDAMPIRRVITRELRDGDCRESSMVSAVVLAAGVGRRMRSVEAPQPTKDRLADDPALKLALRLGGKSLLRHVVEAALAAPVDEVVVVLGHGAAELEHELPRDPRVRTVHNPDYATGQSSSLKAGINAIAARAEAAVFLLGDQPLISSQAIEAVVNAFRSRHSAVVRPRYRGTPGHPVLFSRALFPELLQVTGDQGGRELLARHQAEVVMVDLNLESPVDIDTRDDYLQLVRKFPDLEKL